MKKILKIVLIIIAILMAGYFLFFLYMRYLEASSSNCDIFKSFLKGNCVCPEGYRVFGSSRGDYCATDSQKPCTSRTDCPDGEGCVSGDGKNWSCSGELSGCFHPDPNKPELMVCQ